MADAMAEYVSTGVRVPAGWAYETAGHIMAGLAPGAHRIEVAGSMRRGRPDVGDIELVAVPIVDTVPDGMFATQDVNRLTDRIDLLIEQGTLASHPTDPKRGDRYSKLLHPGSGLQVDLFSATADTFGIIYLIRTGPADYSRRMVTDMRRRGFHVGGGALHRGGLGCGAYTCEVVPTPEEGDVYRALGLTFISPDLRS